MLIKEWEHLPPEMQIEELREYYNVLKKKQISLFIKRVVDIVVSSILIILFLPVFLIFALIIKIDSRGPVFYRQVRVTQYNKKFRIFKFRTMYQGADNGSQVTKYQDERITRFGKIVRSFRLDEICQLLNVLSGNMTLVSIRPEIPKYTEQYTFEMMATLLLPAGITSLASIVFKDEANLLNGVEDIDKTYVDQILPLKMSYNLKQIVQFSIWNDIKLIYMTVFVMLGKEVKGDFNTFY